MELLHEDRDVVAVNKPAGIAVIPGRGEQPEDALRARLEAARQERLWVVHRLDRDTSGVVLFARNAEAHRRLSMAFESRDVDKTYLAWARGALPAESGVIDAPLHPARKGKMRPALPGESGALPSRTRYRVLDAADTVLGPIASLEARPETGRQHQIRVHLRSIGVPLLVDPLYGGAATLEAGALGPESPAVHRLTLHAAAVTFPSAAGRSTVTAPLPADLRALARWLAR